MIPLLTDDSLSLSRQIYSGLRQAMLNGTFRAGEQLPSTRALADQLSVSRTVVVIAYEQLLAEGFVTGRTGSGTFVSEQLAYSRVVKEREPADLKLSRFGTAANDANGRLLRHSGVMSRPRYDFSYGRSNTDLFPFETWRRVMIAKLRKAPIRELDYGPSAGSPSLREAISDHLRRARGLACDASQVIIVNGSQQALDITARVLLDVGEPIVIENPQYQGIREIFSAAGKLIPVRVDGEGLITSALPARARVAVVTPSHQFPTGAVLPLSRRLDLLDWAKRVNAVIVEDDYDGEFRYEGQPVEPLQALDRDERVIYVGTFSRTVFPSLRLGYLIAPTSLVSTFIGAKWLCDRHTATLEQETLADFIRSGAYERHLRRARKALSERKRELLTSLRSTFGSSVGITGENAGSHVVIWPKAHVFEEEIVGQANSLGVGIYGIAPYYIGQTSSAGFLLGYSRLTPREIHEGVRRLGQISSLHESATVRAKGKSR